MRAALFLGLAGFMVPEGIEKQQAGDEEEHMADAEESGKMPAEESAAEHADELERLVEAVDAPQAGSWCQLADEVVDRGHESCDGNAVDEAQQRELPGRCNETLRDGDKACECQGGKEDFM